jgi:hypothetical protein
MKRVMASAAFSRRSPAAVRPSVSGMRASNSASANGPGVGSAMPTLVSSQVRRVSSPLLVASDRLSVVAKPPFVPFGPQHKQPMIISTSSFGSSRLLGTPRGTLWRGDRPIDHPPAVEGTMSVLSGDCRLLPGQKTSARKVLFGRGSPDWTHLNHQWREPYISGNRCPLRRRRLTLAGWSGS